MKRIQALQRLEQVKRFMLRNRRAGSTSVIRGLSQKDAEIIVVARNNAEARQFNGKGLSLDLISFDRAARGREPAPVMFDNQAIIEILEWATIEDDKDPSVFSDLNEMAHFAHSAAKEKGCGHCSTISTAEFEKRVKDTEKEVTLHLLGRDLFSSRYDGYKLDKINLTIATQITKRSELRDLIRSLQILTETLEREEPKHSKEF